MFFKTLIICNLYSIDQKVDEMVEPNKSVKKLTSLDIQLMLFHLAYMKCLYGNSLLNNNQKTNLNFSKSSVISSLISFYYFFF